MGALRLLLKELVAASLGLVPPFQAGYPQQQGPKWHREAVASAAPRLVFDLSHSRFHLLLLLAQSARGKCDYWSRQCSNQGNQTNILCLPKPSTPPGWGGGNRVSSIPTLSGRSGGEDSRGGAGCQQYVAA